MKLKTLILYFLIILGNYCFSQNNNNRDLALFNKGNGLYELVYEDLNIDYTLSQLDTTKVIERAQYRVLVEQKEEILERSLEYFEELIDEYPKSKMFFRAMNNSALISTQLDYINEAIEYYKRIIKSKADDKEKGGIGEGIMAEPYALYKNRACKSLAEIYLLRKDFKEAIKYINLTKKYPYQHFCGNEYAENDIYIATLYAKNYIGLNNIEKALEYSLPHVFYNGLASNLEILEITLNLLKSNYTKEQLNSELKKSLRNIKLKKRKGYKYGVTTFLNIKIELSSEMYSLPDSDFNYEQYEKLSELEKYIINFKESEFYKEIKKHTP